MNDLVLGSSIFKQKRTTEKLVEESRADTDFYLFLCVSVFITTLGLMVNNAIVVVGAMLVAPMLYPILALGLGIVTASGSAIRRALTILVKSFAVGVVIAFATSFLIDIGQRGVTEQLQLLIQPDLFMFFLISLAAGVVASFSWVTQKTAMSFPGVAITVSLVPPLAAVGISLALLSQPLFVGSLMLFGVNLLGIVLASIAIFSLFGFQRARAWQDERIRKEEEAITKHKTQTEQEEITQGSASDNVLREE